ncbi:MAG: hypothetical protein Q7V88_07810 [Actinomycetota bacterium]|nr:hypothetical protein [Actinomycetota bacterium]
MKIHRLTLATLALVATGLTACSSTAKQSITSASTTSSVPTSSSVEVSTTTAPPATAAPVTAAPATAAPVTAPPATAAPATAAPAPSYSLYDEVPGPNVPGGHTDPFVSSGTLGNGVYWVSYSGGETMTPSIEVYQAFFGAECISKAAEMSDECLNDIFVLADPFREIDDLAFAEDVFLTVADSNTQRSYWITPDELRTVRASSPSVDDAPGGVFVPFPFLMTVQNGEIVKFEQVWVP